MLSIALPVKVYGCRSLASLRDLFLYRYSNVFCMISLVNVVNSSSGAAKYIRLAVVSWYIGSALPVPMSSVPWYAKLVLVSNSERVVRVSVLNFIESFYLM